MYSTCVVCCSAQFLESRAQHKEYSNNISVKMASSLTFRRTTIIHFIFLSLVPMVLTKSCKKINNCKCEMDDGSGVISLWDLDNSDGKPRFTNIPDTAERSYSFLFNPCTPLKYTSGKEASCTGSNLCQKDAASGTSYYPCDASDPSFEVDKSGHVVMIFKSKFFQSHSRYFNITLICDEKEKSGSFGEGISETLKDGKRTSEYFATFTTKYACLGSGSSSSLSTGSILLIIFFPLVLLYLIVGILFNIYVRHQKSVPEVLPNHTFWADLPFLVKDGCVFSFGKMKGCCRAVSEKARRQEYTQI